MEIQLQAKARLSAFKIMADDMPDHLKHLAQSMAQKLGVGLKGVERLGTDEAAIYFEAPFKPEALDKVPHKGRQYYPDGNGEYLEIEHWFQKESILYVAL